MRKKKTILIVGGTGFIGSHLAKTCLKKKFKVLILSRNIPHVKDKQFSYISCNILNKKKLKNKIKDLKIDYVINLAGNIDHSNNKITYQTHFLGAKNLADIFVQKKIEKFIHIGSCLEYGKKKSPHRENMRLNIKALKSSYSKAKLRATNYIIDLCKKKLFPAIVLRVYQVFGPGQKSNRLIPYVIKSCLNNMNFNCSDGNQKKDFLYIEDFISILFKILNKKNKELDGKIINIGTGKPVQIKKIINLIRDSIKKGRPIFGKIKLRKDEPSLLYPNINLAFKKLKLNYKYDLLSGIQKTIAYYKIQH